MSQPTQTPAAISAANYSPQDPHTSKSKAPSIFVKTIVADNGSNGTSTILTTVTSIPLPRATYGALPVGTSSPPPPSSSKPLGYIIGPVVGGVVLLLALAVLGFFLFRRRRARRRKARRARASKSDAQSKYLETKDPTNMSRPTPSYQAKAESNFQS